MKSIFRSVISKVLVPAVLLIAGMQLVSAKSAYTGFYSTPGKTLNHAQKQNVWFPIQEQKTPWNSISYFSDQVFSGSGWLQGVVTDQLTGLPLPGVYISPGNAMTNDAGEYFVILPEGISLISYWRTGYQTKQVTAVILSGDTVFNNVTLQEFPHQPACAYAVVDSADTQCTVTWCPPEGPYELLYDDGSAENYAAWAFAGNINAVKFTPQGFPAMVVGAKLYVGDGSFPTGGNFIGQPFTIAVFAADGTSGLPGTLVDSVTVTTDTTGWITVTGLDALIVSGDFYIAMIQGSNAPDCAPIGVDETLPKAFRSYSRNDSQNMPWVLSPFQDFMIRAIVSGTVLPGDNSISSNRVMVPQRVPDMISVKCADAMAGKEMNNLVITAPEEFQNSEGLFYYQPVRSFMVNPDIPPQNGNWTLYNTNFPSTVNTLTEGGTTWAALAAGWYAWGVRAFYTGGGFSEYTWTNLVPHKLNIDLTFNVQLECGFVPAEGATLTLTGSDYPFSIFTGTISAAGTCTFSNVIKGHYHLSVSRPEYEIVEQDYYFTQNQTILVVMEQMRYKPRSLFVDDMTLVATWEPALSVMLDEDFENDPFPPAGWQITSQGSVGWFVTFNASYGFCQIPLHTRYAFVSDDGGGPNNNGCCDYLITPAVDLTNAPGYKLTYSSYNSGDYGQMAFVEMSLDSCLTWTPIFVPPVSGQWTNNTIDLSAYSGINGLKRVWFAFHADDGGNWASGVGVDDVRISSGNVPVQGYTVFLDGAEVGQTQDTTWTFNPSTIHYGHTYVAGVAGLYCMGYSEADTFSFTSHFLVPPTNLTAVADVSATSGATILNWASPLPGDFSVSGSVPRDGVLDPGIEYSPYVTQHTGSNNCDVIWDVLFLFLSNSTSQYGVGSDNNSVFTTVWNDSVFYKYDFWGNLIESFTIAGVANIRDLAYDGTYFYGSDASSVIYCLDFTNKLLVNTINTQVPDSIRHITYDHLLNGGNGGFWCGNWNTLYAIQLNGTIIQQVNSFSLSGCSGSAYSGSDGHLYLYDQGGNGADILQFDVSTLTITGVVHDMTYLPGFSQGGVAGGLEFAAFSNTAFEMLTGTIQQASPMIYGLDFTECDCLHEAIGYNLYRNDSLVTNIPYSTNEYWDTDLLPGDYCYEISALWDLTPYGFPGQTGESSREGPACVEINYGFPLPFTEDWSGGQFGLNLWTAGDNWVVDGQAGNPPPAAKFSNLPLLANYESSLESYWLDATTISTTTQYKLWFDFNLSLSVNQPTGLEKLSAEIWNGAQWIMLKEYQNDTRLDTLQEHLAIPAELKGSVFKIRLKASGIASNSISYWLVDNIAVYPEFILKPPRSLTAVKAGVFHNKTQLNWDPPLSGDPLSFILDDGTAENGWAINPASEAWLGNEFAVNVNGILRSINLYWMANASSDNEPLSLDVFDANGLLIGSSAPFTPVSDAWQTVSLNDIPFDGTFYVMVHWNNQAGNTHYLGSDENGPNAANNYGWYHDGASWAHLSDFGYAANVFLIRANAFTECDNPVVFGPGAALSGLPDKNLLTNKPVTSKQTISFNSIITGVIKSSSGLLSYDIYRRSIGLYLPWVHTDTTEWVMIKNTTGTSYLDDRSGLGISGNMMNEYYVIALYDEGASGTSNIAREIFYETTEEPFQDQIKVSPNPANTTVTLQFPQSVRSVQLFNYSGIPVFEQKFTGETSLSINTSQYQPGVYMVRFINADGEAMVRKLVVVH